MRQPVFLAVYRKRYFRFEYISASFSILLAAFVRLPGVRCPCLKAMETIGFLRN